MKNKIFGVISLLVAIALSSTAAFYSVIGLSTIFSAAATQVIIMAGIMEFGKIIVTTLLHNYWDKIEWKIKTYLTISVLILMIITSAGIYGLLSSAYQETALKDSINERKIELVESKIERYREKKIDLISEKNIIDSDISNLRNSLGNNVIRYTDNEGNQVVSTSSSNRKAYQKQLEIANSRKDEIVTDINITNDSIAALDIKLIEIKNSSEVSSELLPLKYLAKVSGLEMDRVVNLFIILLIIVFDPLAIALLLSANIIFGLGSRKIKPEIEEETIEPKIQEAKKVDKLDELSAELKKSIQKKRMK